MDAENILEAMKAELKAMRHEKICMEVRLKAAENALEEKKRVLEEYKAIEKLADDLMRDVIETGSDDVNENNGLDEETMKGLLEEAMRDFTQALNEAQSRRSRPEDGGDGGGYEDINIVKEAPGDDGGNGGASGHA